MFIYAAKKFVIDDTVEFTAFHMLVLGGVYMDSAIFIVYFQHVSPVFPLFLLILPLQLCRNSSQSTGPPSIGEDYKKVYCL